MQNRTLKIGWLYCFLGIYAITYLFIYLNNLNSNLITKLNPIFWLIIFLIAFKFCDRKNRVKAKVEKIQTVFIIMLVYFIIYFLSGLFFGYSNSPYSHDLLSIILNFWSYLTIVFFQEYIRSVLVSNSRKKISLFILITILFIIFELNFNSLISNFDSGEGIFKYSFSVILVIIVRNILLTYLSNIGGFRVSLIYRAPLVFVNLVAPIFPDLDWFMTALSGILLPFITFIIMHYFNDIKTSRESRRRVRKDSPIKKIPLIVFILVLVSFVAGFFKYMPVAVMSNSMANLIKRGDVVVVEKLTKGSVKKLKVNDIIEYQLDNEMIIHRIIKIEKDSNSNLIFTTKGDNNIREDNKKVKEEQVRAKVRLKIPKVGYPSVMLNDFFKNTKPDVEMGKK